MAKAIRSLLPAALLLALLPATAAQGAPKGNASVLFGADAPITSFPYQAALLNRPALEQGRSLWDAQFCGGFILDAQHVGTAAHCVLFEGDDTDATNDIAYPPTSLRVLVGTDLLRISEDPPPTERILDVAAVSFRPGFDPARFDDDAAVLRLTQPIELDGTTRKAIPLRSGLLGAGDVTVSGWGLMETGAAPQGLRQGALEVFPDNATNCAGVYEGYVPQRMLCASGPIDADDAVDSCSGDSGGPLAFGTTPANRVLAGIVSFGSDCGDPDAAGVYSEVWKDAPDNEIDEFLERRPIGNAPQPSAAHTLDGTAQPGQTLTCNAPWSDASSVLFQVQGPGNVAREDASGDPGYAVQPGDVGLALTCLSKAQSDDGFGYARSAPVTVTAAPAPPAPTPQTPPATPPANLQPVPRDTSRPASSVVRRRCTRTVCTLQVQVSDPPTTSGIRTLRGSGRLSYRSRCRRNGRTRSCTRTRTLSVKPQPLGAGRYLVRVRSRTAGRAVLRFVAYDVAGNRQARATQVAVRFGPTPKRR